MLVGVVVPIARAALDGGNDRLWVAFRGRGPSGLTRAATASVSSRTLAIYADPLVKWPKAHPHVLFKTAA
jgi:hypothetical protein